MLPPLNTKRLSSRCGLNKNNNNTSRFERQIDTHEAVETGFPDPNELHMSDFGRFLFGMGEPTDMLATEDIRKCSGTTTIMSDWPRWSQITIPTERTGSATTFLSVTQTHPVRISKVQDREDQNHGKSSKRILLENRSTHENRDKQGQTVTKLLWCCSDPPHKLDQTQTTLKSRSRQKREHFARSCKQDWETEVLVYAQIGYWAPEILPKNFPVDKFMMHGNQRSPSIFHMPSFTGSTAFGNPGRRQIYKFTNSTEIYNCVQEGRATLDELSTLINTCTFGTTTGMKRSTVFREENKQTPKRRPTCITLRSSDSSILSQRFSIKIPSQNRKSAAFSTKSAINTIVIGKLNKTLGVSHYQSIREESEGMKSVAWRLSSSTSETKRSETSLARVDEKQIHPSQVPLRMDVRSGDRIALSNLWHIDSQPLPSSSECSSQLNSKSPQNPADEDAAMLALAEELATANKGSFPSDFPESTEFSTSRSTSAPTSEAFQESISDNGLQKTMCPPSAASAFTWTVEMSQKDAKPTDRRKMTKLSLVRMSLPLFKGKLIVPDLRGRLSLPDLIKEVFDRIKIEPAFRQQRNIVLLKDMEDQFGSNDTDFTDKVVEKMRIQQPALYKILRAQCKTITTDMRKARNLSAGAEIPDLVSQRTDDDPGKRFFLPTVVPIQAPNVKRLKRRETDSRMIYPSISFASSLSDSIAEVPPLNSQSLPKLSRRETVQISIRKTLSKNDMGQTNVSNKWPRSGRTQLRPSELFDIETHVFMLPRLPPKPNSILEAIATELQNISPFVLDHFKRVCSQVVAEYDWVGESDADKMVIALERLAADLLLYRNSSGHSIRYKLMSVIVAGEINYLLRRQFRNTAFQPGQWLDQLLRSLVSVHSSVRTEAAITVALLVSRRRIMSQFIQGNQAMVISGIIHSLFVAGEYYPTSWPEFYTALGYLLQCNQHELICEALIERGQYSGFGGSNACWPRLLAYVYTYWRPKVLHRIDISEKRLSMLLDAAYINPISRDAACECFAALSDYFTLRSHLFSYWTWKAQQTADDESMFI